MGVYLSTAKTTKQSEDGGDAEKSSTRFGVTSMQGWRQSMEDSHLALPRLEKLEPLLSSEVSLYGVFDGHGGPAVSEWIALHMAEAVKEVVESVVKERDVLVATEQQPFEVALLSESLQRTFLKLDEDMQTKENREEIRKIHTEKTAINEAEQREQSGASPTGGAASQSIKGLLASQPRTLIQALLGGGGGGKPVIKVVQQDGESYFQISSPDEEDEEETSTGNDGEHAASDDSDEDKHKQPKIEEIIEDEHITAPDAKSPVLQAAAAEILNDEKSASPADKETAGPYDEMDVEPDEGDDRMQLPGGGPENCGAAVVVACLVSQPRPYLITANAGDSRCVLCRRGIAIEMSEDHKPGLAVENARIAKAGGTVIAGRVDGNLNLSRTLGDLFYKKNRELKPEEQKITAFPDIRVIPLTKEDEFVILACDGIWDCISSQGACDFVRSRLHETPDRKLSSICEELCDQCLAQNPMDSEGGIGCDNMTIIIVLLNEECRKNGIDGASNFYVYHSSK